MSDENVRDGEATPKVQDDEGEYALRAMLYHPDDQDAPRRKVERDPFWAEDYADDPPLSARAGKPAEQYQARADVPGAPRPTDAPAVVDPEQAEQDWRETQDATQQVEPYTMAYTAGTVASPPFDPLQMSMMNQTCDILPPTVDALVVNIEQQGWELKHWSEDVDPEDDESQVQHQIAEGFFESFDQTNVRAGLREDKVLTGNAYVEVLRETATQARWRARKEMGLNIRAADYSPTDMKTNVDPEGGDVRKPYALVHAPSFLTRICVPDADSKKYVEATQYRRIAGEWSAVKVRRRFRKFVQVEPSTGRYKFFKEFGDPRTLDAETGQYQAPGVSIPAKRRATEIYHFGRPTRTSPYEVPKFAAALMAIGGLIKAEEVNYLYFENKGVPPLLILVSGGALTRQATENVRQTFKESKGLKNFHSAIVLEATSKAPVKGEAFGPTAAANSTVRIEVKPLMDAIQKDALFMEYIKLQQRIIRGVWRVPPILMGMAEDYSYATAFVSLKMFEEQVCKPARAMWDDFVNHCILPALGVHDWYFQSQGVRVGDPQSMASLIAAGATVGAGNPTVYGKVLSEALGVEFPSPPEEIADQPFALTLANASIAKAPALFSTTARADDPSGIAAAVQEALLGAAREWEKKQRAA